ncbi:hypothetical protein [Nocardia brevicatena]|uniref:hypothetical protein n=1 Tax=Nocardia brevicatena TaxID=37327 RepID=UPI0012FB444A|nr:hypothetical protein [Nocardia brevicatena]
MTRQVGGPHPIGQLPQLILDAGALGESRVRARRTVIKVVGRPAHPAIHQAPPACACISRELGHLRDNADPFQLAQMVAD